jgi:ribonucleoside-diphosphate reductase alpha chain
MKRDSFGRPQDATATQPISHDVLKEKYLKAGESGFEDVYRRVARALASVEAEADRAKYEALFLDNLHAGAIGAGRIMSAAGTDIQATLINCFVQPVGDCIQGVDDGGYPGIYEALREAAETMRRGGGVGYDFSRIRPRGAEVKATASVASGPCSYINVFDQSCSTVESAGARRGAQMGVLRIDHPDVMDFITAKRTPGRWNNFNVSVGVPDTFMQALGDDQPWELVHRARPSAGLIAQGAFQRADGLVGLPDDGRARTVGYGDEVGLRLRRAGHPVSGPHQPGQQPALLRVDCGDQPLRRAAVAALRVLRPRADHPDTLRAPSVRVRWRAGVRFRVLRALGRSAGAGA